MRRTNLLTYGCMCALILGTTGPTTAQETPEESSGLGRYFSEIPQGRERPSDSSGAPVIPRVTQDFIGPISTNDWSSSIVFPRYAGNDHGQPMFPWPLALQASDRGMMLAGSPDRLPGNGGYFSYFNTNDPDVIVGVTGLIAAETRLAHQGDWTLTTEMRDGTRSLRSTFGRGLPLASFRISGGDAQITLASGATVLSQSPGRMIFSVGDSVYGAFAPDDAIWTRNGDLIGSDLAGGDWFSIGVLPNAETATIELFTRHGMVEIIDSTVDWAYQPDVSRMEVTYSFDAVSHDKRRPVVLTGLLPHQRPYSDAIEEGIGFETARGWMELVSVESFTLSLPVAPILPALPVTDTIDLAEMRELLERITSESDSITAPDSYWAGKQMGRVACAAQTAHEIGEPEIRDELLSRLRQELEDWFTTGTAASSNRIEAESFSASEGTALGEGENGGTAVTEIGGGDRLTFSGLDLAGRQPNRVLIRFASGAGAGGSALIRLRVGDENGTILSEAAVGNTGGWNAWTTVPLSVASSASELIDGSQDLVFTCDTQYQGDVLSLDWFEWDITSSGSGTKDFAYAPEWNTLLAHPGSYGLAGELNDHHFHYGYFIAAAATIARFDPEWAAQENWGGMVDLLVKDAANWDRSDERFPFLRNFEPYVGHAYASGHAGFAAGNNQESSSESTHFSQAVALWGAATGREQIRDLGLFLHSLETLAVEQYWFDVDQTVYPEGSDHPLAGIVWDAGATYGTWWTGNPEEIHGINLLPITGGSLYLGRSPDAMQRAWDHLIEQNGGLPVEWRDVLWAWRALFDPESARTWLDDDDGWNPEPGNSRAWITYWIQSLSDLGTIRHEITANTPNACVFERSGLRTYVAYNPQAIEQGTVFSDGTQICVPPGETVHRIVEDPCGLPADLNSDRRVNGADLAILLNEWGPCEVSCVADLDGDGVVGGSDLTRLLSQWN